MTREELKEHCKKTVEQCEMWAIHRGEEPSGKVYEEHKLILNILEQEPCDDAISREAVIAEIDKWYDNNRGIDAIEDLIIAINYKLPSVQPSRKLGTCKECANQDDCEMVYFAEDDFGCNAFERGDTE